MSWSPRTKILALAGTIAGVAGAIAVGVFWPSTPSTPSPLRPLLAGLKHDSQNYLNRHAVSAMTCPTGATKCWHWGMQEAAGNLTDDLSGDAAVLTAVGTPVYRLHTPIPWSDGFSRRAIGFEGASTYFQAAAAAPGDQTTNDFSVSGFVCPRAGATGDRIVGKRDAGAGGLGYAVRLATADKTQLAIGIADASGATTGPVTPAGTLVDGICKFFTVNFDRDGNATAMVGGVLSATVVNISARQLTIASPANLTLGRAAAAASNYWDGRIGYVLIANGLTTLSEHQAMSKAFTPPTGVTYTQTTTWKWPLPPEAGTFGERLGTYGAGQWPVGYSAREIDATKNPLGLGFPKSGTVVNSTGYTNEFDLWVVGGSPPTVVANVSEAPDGSLTADRISFTANGDQVYKVVVGGGNFLAGERWYARVKYKWVSGDCTGVRLLPDAGGGTIGDFQWLSNDLGWKTAVAWAQGGGMSKRPRFLATVHGSCVIDVADAEYYQNNLPFGSCTACTGNVNCTCNASYYAQSWSDKATLMPSNLERLEVVTAGTTSPLLHTATAKRVLAAVGQYAEVGEGQQPYFALYGQGGGIEALIKGKPLQIEEEYRSYVAGWNVRDGLTNTSPRIYASMQMERNRTGGLKYQPQVLGARQLADVEPRKTDLNAYTFTVGCDASGANCSSGLVEYAELYARPAQNVVSVDTDIAVAADFTGPALLQRGYTPDLCAFSFGVADANRWCWNGAGYGGSLYDTVNGVPLAPTGTPTYQVNSGLLARGQGRRGAQFLRASTEMVAASAAATNSIGSATAYTMVMSMRPLSADNIHRMGSSRTTAAGYSILVGNGNSFYCNLSDGVNRRYCWSGINVVRLNEVQVVSCQWKKTGANWNDPTARINGVTVALGSCAGTVPTGNIVNAFPFAVGCTGDCAAGDNYNGEYFEVLLNNTALSDAQIDALYKQTVKTGKYWTAPTGTVAHYKFNEATITNGVGLRDSSGNGNHLTVVTGTPDAQYRDMPWPAGSGVTKPAIQYDNGASYHALASPNDIAAARDDEPFSACYWWRGAYGGDFLATSYNFYKGGGASSWNFFNLATEFQYFGWICAVGSSNAFKAVNYTDGRYHLICGKATKSAPGALGVWSPAISIDGSVFTTGTTCTGSIGANTAQLRLGSSSNISGGTQTAGAAVWRGYALTDADVASLYNANGPVSTLTHARTSTGPKGACYDVGIDPVDGMRVRCFADNRVPMRYDSTLCGLPGNGRMCLAEPVHSAVTNLNTNSEDFTTWSVARSTVAPNVIIAPDGTLTAESITEDNTAAASHMISKLITATAATNSINLYMKKGNRWGVFVAPDSGSFGAYVDLSNCTLGNSTLTTATVTGAANGWCKLSGTFTPTAGARTWYIFLAEANADYTFSGDPVTYPVGAYVWGGSFYLGTATHYCPTDASTQTCNAPTSNYIAAANLASWDELQGVVSQVSRNSGGASQVVWRLKLAGPSNGSWQYNTGDTYLYNSASVLQQRFGLSTIPTQPAGTVTVFDSQGAFYGTRRGAMRFYSADYAGLSTIYTTDTGANWAPSVGSDLWLGMSSTGTLQIDGSLANVSVWKTR